MALEDREEKKVSAVLEYYDEEGRRVEMDAGLDELPENSVAVIQVIGPMIKYGNIFCWGADELSMLIQAAIDHDNISGIVLMIDSGGGAVDAIPLFAGVLRNRTKPVVALCDLAASAAYYTAIYCDHIMADNNISAEFGSIGVMVSFYDYSEYEKEKGIKRHVIYAPESTYKNKPFELALEGKYDLMKSDVLSPLAQKFQKAVRDQRPGIDEGVEGILNGRMFYADTALQHGMIDSVGDIRSAIQKVKQLAAGYQLRSVRI